MQTPNLFEADVEAMRAIDGTFPPLNWLPNKPMDPVNGDVWVETDTGNVYVWNNKCWIQVVGSYPEATS